MVRKLNGDPVLVSILITTFKLFNLFYLADSLQTLSFPLLSI